MANRLENLLRACTVRVVGPHPGAGFFVAQGKVLTCCHVLRDDATIGDLADLKVVWEVDRADPVTLVVTGVRVLSSEKRPIPGLSANYPDIAVLDVNAPQGHPCVYLHAAPADYGDEFQAYGYPREGGSVLQTPVTLRYRGTKGAAPYAYLDLSSDRVKPGMSGAALLNLRTCRVHGIIVASKSPACPDGALAVPWNEVTEDLSDVLEDNQAFHVRDRRWDDASRTALGTAFWAYVGVLLEEITRRASRLSGGGPGWWRPLRRRGLGLVVAGCAAVAAGITFPLILSQPGASADHPSTTDSGQPGASGQPQRPSPLTSPFATLTDPVPYGEGSVQVAAFSPDGKLVATGDGNGSTYLWDVASPGHPVATLTAPVGGDGVDGVAFSPNGKLVATADGNVSAYVWDLASPSRPVATLTDPDSNSLGGGVNVVAFSPDGKLVATGDGNDGAYVWDLASPGHPVATLTDPGHVAGAGGVSGVAFSPDGKMVATANGDGSTYLWDVASPGHPAATLTGGGVNGVAFSPDGKMVVTEGGDNNAYVWDVASPGYPVATLTDPRSSEVAGVVFSPDGKMVATVDGSVSAYLWRPVRPLTGYRQP